MFPINHDVIYPVVRRVRVGALQLLLQLREQRGDLRHARVQRLVLRVQRGELVLVRAPRARARDGRVLPAAANTDTDTHRYIHVTMDTRRESMNTIIRKERERIVVEYSSFGSEDLLNTWYLACD